jgi:peroxiredoxin Q/BCP
MRMRSLQGVRLSAMRAARRSAVRLLCFMAAGCLAGGLPAYAAGAADASSPVEPAVGMEAPAFHLQDQNGAWHSLSDYRGKWLVLYFYPKDGTPGCTTQACEFRDNIFAFRQRDAVIVGISVDDVESHKDFAGEQPLPFTLLADSTKQTARAYGVLHTALGFMDLASRETFIIDPRGRIAKHYAAVVPKGHSAAVLGDLEALQLKAKLGS